MIRTYADWRAEANAAKRNVTKLGNELRERWSEWKSDPAARRYANLNECLQAELGISAQALRDRNYRDRRKRDDTEAATGAKRSPYDTPKWMPPESIHDRANMFAYMVTEIEGADLFARKWSKAAPRVRDAYLHNLGELVLHVEKLSAEDSG